MLEKTMLTLCWNTGWPYKFLPPLKLLLIYPSNIICYLLLKPPLRNLPASSHETTAGNCSLAAIRRANRVIFLPLLCPIVLRMSAPTDCDLVGECARNWEPWPSWQGGKPDYHFPILWVVGALELTSGLLLPLLDWSCQSCSTHVCVITATDTSSGGARWNEQTET